MFEFFLDFGPEDRKRAKRSRNYGKFKIGTIQSVISVSVKMIIDTSIVRLNVSAVIIMRRRDI